jgi:outer membrane lipoprotein SlyB
MKRVISVITIGSLLLAGCAYPATQMQLNAYNAGCAQGDMNACYAAQYTAQQANFEAQQNAAAAATGIAVLGVLGAVAIGANYGHGHYGHGYYHRGGWR